MPSRRQPLRVAILAALVAALLGLAAAPALAFHRADANDTPGRLDVSKVRLVVKHDQFVVTLRTYGTWKTSDLAFGFAEFSTDIRFGTTWRQVLIASNTGFGAGTICTFHQKSGRSSHCNDKVTVTHPDGHTVTAVFPVTAVHRGLHGFRFSLGSFMANGPGCTHLTCVDRVPNKAWFRSHT